MDTYAPQRRQSNASEADSTVSSNYKTALTSRRDSTASNDSFTTTIEEMDDSSFIEDVGHRSEDGEDGGKEEVESGFDQEDRSDSKVDPAIFVLSHATEVVHTSTVREGISERNEAVSSQGQGHKAFVTSTQSTGALKRFLLNITNISNAEKCPYSIDITRSSSDLPGASDAEEYVSYLNHPDIDPTEKSKIHGIANLGLFLPCVEDPGMEDEAHMKNEVRAFVQVLQGSEARDQITHLDIGYEYVLHDLAAPKVWHEDKVTFGEKRLQEEMDAFSKPCNALELVQNTHNRALLLRMVRWIAIALPNVRTLTLHMNSSVLLCSSDSRKDRYIDELVAQFPNLEEVNVVCAEPFVALSWMVWDDRVPISGERFTSDVAEKLRGRKYYQNGGRRWSRSTDEES